MNKYLLFALLLLCGVIYFQHRNTVRLTEEKDRYRSNNTALLSEMKRLRTDSTTMAVDMKGLRLTVDEYKRFREEDAAIIKRLGIKIKNLKSAARHEMGINGPINAELKDTVIVRDTLLTTGRKIEMQTPYIRINGLIEGNKLIGNIHIPVTLNQVVWVEYKRYWIFWKKVKSIHQTIYSNNPYAKITYSEYIRIE